MARHVVLLRGVNLVRRNRVAMPELRTALEAAGFGEVKTYLQSGNAVVSSALPPARVAAAVRALLDSEFGHDITVLVRSPEELAAIVSRDPLRHLVVDDRRYLVTFVSSNLPSSFAGDLRAVATEEPFAVAGREIYSWHPDGIGRTPLWERLASRSLGVDATSRNWTTVKALAAMAGAPTSR